MEALLPPNIDRGPRILAAFWAPFPLTVVLLYARLYVQISRKNVGVADWFVLIAWVSLNILLSHSTAID
jgi:hypothetical protein